MNHTLLDVFLASAARLKLDAGPSAGTPEARLAALKARAASDHKVRRFFAMQRQLLAAADPQGAPDLDRLERLQPASTRRRAPAPPPADAAGRVLITARHGLGDSVQLTMVLAHLAKHRPEWCVDLAVLDDKASIFAGEWWASGQASGGREPPGGKPTVHTALNTLALDTLIDRLGPGYERVYDLVWSEPTECFAEHPSTKVEKCLRDVFGLAPDPELWGRYRVDVREPSRQKAAAWLASITQGLAPRGDGRYPVMVLHYRGSSSAALKDIEHHEAQWIARNIGRDSGLLPVVLDWSGDCPFADGQLAHRPPAELWRTGEGRLETHADTGEMIAALIEQSALCIAIDSGPGHVAGATTTPTIVVWKDLHPLHYYHPIANVTHFVPAHHARALANPVRAGLDFFTRHYRHRVYQSFLADLHGLAADVLGEREMSYYAGHWVRGATHNQDLEIVRDVYEGDCYQLRGLPLAREVIVDAGACLGSFARLALERNPTARVIAVECCPENWEVLARNLRGVAEIEQAALTYEPDVALLNAVYPGCASTGGSTIVPWSQAVAYVAGGPEGKPGVVDEHGQKREYFADFRPMITITLEQLRAKYGLGRIDVLKLDCEGSEYSILGNADLTCVGVILGEYHGRARWEEFLPRLLARDGCPPRYEELRGGEFGLFRLTR